MENFDARKLSNDVVQDIQGYKQEKLEQLAKDGVFLNQLIREDIFRLLDRECTVVYFPEKDSCNNGFHKTYRVDGKKRNLVYINTEQYREKQIFTAAHELGHIWKVDEHVVKSGEQQFDFDTCERIMNRFAAELLMPEEIFLQYADTTVKKARDRNQEKTPERGRIVTIADMLELIAGAMNEFFVPYKSVLYRLYELDRITEKCARMLWGENELLTKARIDEYVKKYAKEQCYDRLYKADRRKLIDGLKERLDQASAAGELPEQWIDAFYERFSLEKEMHKGVLDNQIE